MKVFCQDVQDVLAKAEAKNPMRELFGVTMAAAMDASVFAYFIAMLAIEIARRWRAEMGAINLNSVVQFPSGASLHWQL
jgi:deoxyribose-phosphate aldolase